MEKIGINPSGLAKPVGYSHGFEVKGGRLLFLSGQVPFDKQGSIVGRGDIVAQFRQVCENLKTLAEKCPACEHEVTQTRAGEITSMGHSKRSEDQLLSRTCSSLIRRER